MVQRRTAPIQGRTLAAWSDDTALIETALGSSRGGRLSELVEAGTIPADMAPCDGRDAGADPSRPRLGTEARDWANDPHNQPGSGPTPPLPWPG